MKVIVIGCQSNSNTPAEFHGRMLTTPSEQAGCASKQAVNEVKCHVQYTGWQHKANTNNNNNQHQSTQE